MSACALECRVGRGLPRMADTIVDIFLVQERGENRALKQLSCSFQAFSICLPLQCIQHCKSLYSEFKPLGHKRTFLSYLSQIL